MRITKIFAQGWWPIKGAILALRRLKGLSVGITYNPDVQATIAYSFDAKVDEKAISDLNPGIKVYGAHIFEVSKELFDARTWNVLVDADKLAIVKF